MTPEFEDLKSRIDVLNERLTALFPALAAARKAYMVDRSPENREALERVEAEASALHSESLELVEMLPAASGLPLELFEQAERERKLSASRPDHQLRESLTAEHVETTFNIDDLLPQALERLEGLLPAGWLDEQPADATRIDGLLHADAFLSLTKGLRVASESSPVHRFRQALRVSRDYMKGHPLYDHFAGALLVPTVVQLARQGPSIGQVGGERDERLRQLWAGPSAQVDATIYELLTAAACVEMGRSVEFLEATSEKSPDIRCHDPYPTVIECKRQQPLSQYEIDEEAAMRALFVALRSAARAKGIFGVFHLTLSVEVESVDAQDVIAKLVGQRLAPDPERDRHHGWGTTSFTSERSLVDLPSETRIYSPNMLKYLFDWTSDLPEWDGICCSIDPRGEPIVDRISSPVALIWKNISSNALRKRTWAPVNLFGKASLQVPPGEFGVVYVCYSEGGRAEVANMRVEAFTNRIQEFEHSARIRLPIAILSRLYSRPLAEGQPDLIESGLRYLSDSYGDPSLFEVFPTRIFT